MIGIKFFLKLIGVSESDQFAINKLFKFVLKFSLIFSKFEINIKLFFVENQTSKLLCLR